MLDNCVLYFNLVFENGTKFPNILGTINDDHDLHVQLQYMVAIPYTLFKLNTPNCICIQY